MSQRIHSLQQLCLVDAIKLGETCRSAHKSQILRDIFTLISSASDIRLWLHPHDFLSTKGTIISVGRVPGAGDGLYITRCLPVSATDAMRLFVRYDLLENRLSDETSWWPAYIGTIEAGRPIIEDDCVICWSIDDKRNAVTYVFLEYARHDTTLNILLLESSSIDIITLFEGTIRSLSEAWDVGVIHSNPSPENVMVCIGTGAKTWKGLSAVVQRKHFDSATSSILTVVAHYFALMQQHKNPEVVSSVRNYLLGCLAKWKVNATLTDRLALSTAETIPDSSELKLWDRELDFLMICGDFSSVSPIPNRENNDIPMIEKPRYHEGFLYLSITLKTRGDITTEWWDLYEQYFQRSFTITKSEVKDLLESAKETVSWFKDRNNETLVETKSQACSLFCDWVAVKVLVDSLATRVEYRSSVIVDILTANIENYIIEIKAKLLRITGEWEDMFSLLTSILDYDTIHELNYRWETIRDTSRRLR